jgi:hypothetical protein
VPRLDQRRDHRPDGVVREIAAERQQPDEEEDGETESRPRRMEKAGAFAAHPRSPGRRGPHRSSVGRRPDTRAAVACREFRDEGIR